MKSEFFLGANSKSGFFSHYDRLTDDSAQRVFIIKGSPGGGKSTLIRRVAEAAEAAGHDTELIRCSSDPDSLDGLVIPALGTALVDGTSPHSVEPKYPLAVERYLDISLCADSEGLRAEREKIVSLFKCYRACYTRAYRMTGCAGALAGELTDIALGAVDPEKLRRKAAGIISREIKGKGDAPTEVPRFLSSISPKGYVTLFDTVRDMCSRVYVLEDSCGLSAFMLSAIKQAALKASYRTVCCYSPLLPDRLEHIIIPELGLGFVTSNKLAKYPHPYTRKCRLDAMLAGDALKPRKQKFLFTGKLYAAMLNEACTSISEAKELHDRLEAVYNPYIDFDRVLSTADSLIRTILP